MSAAQKKIRGTREWAVANIDCCTGCSHGCRYCYARYDAVVRKGLVEADDWLNLVVRPAEIDKRQPLYSGQVMFPSAHDIFPEILEECLKVLRHLFEAGNKVLIVSKPHQQCIRRICDEFSSYMDKLLFRFTITAQDNSLLQFWEPHAPGYEERLSCLKYAYRAGYQTSVSIEPMLDSENVVSLVSNLQPWVSHSVWIGKMNKIDERVDLNVPGMKEELSRIREGQTEKKIKEIYQLLKGNQLIRWKESIKEIVGIESPGQAGMDI